MDITEGTEVVVLEPGRGGRTWTGVVTKAARVWLTIESMYSPSSGWREWRMRRDTQDEGNRQYSQYNVRFYTLEQWAEREADLAASELLGRHGISISRDSSWSNREGRARLAALIESATQEAE